MSASSIDHCPSSLKHTLILKRIQKFCCFTSTTPKSMMSKKQSKFPRWDELYPELLGLIFSNLSFIDKLKNVQCVCKSWRKAVTGPYCWQEIDMERWSNLNDAWRVDRVLRMLIARSAGTFRELDVAYLQTDSIFSLIIHNAGSLEVLRLPGSGMSDSIVVQTAHRLSKITILDLSYCVLVGATALEAIGNNCKLLVTLSRNMYNLPLDFIVAKSSPDAEANAIAATMPRLKHLEISYHRLTTESVMRILFGCPQLVYLDITGCWEVKLENGPLKEKFPNLKVSGLGFYDYDNYW